LTSVRAEIITRRTYCRPAEISEYAKGDWEDWSDVIDRVVHHQWWLWERAAGRPLKDKEKDELTNLREIMLNRECLPSGRTLWLGGTEIAKTREASQFNCAFRRVETVHDVVDCYWLLLQGCGTGFEPIVGTLSGWSRPVKLTTLRTEKTDPYDKGVEGTTEEWSEDGFTWTVRVGDSAAAWAKLPGKLLAQKRPFRHLILDYREIRPGGGRLKNYGWISSGDTQLAAAMEKIVILLNMRACKLLSRIDIMDILNHLGATLSSRRSAEICLVPYGSPEWQEFARAKKDYWRDNPHREQSNNSLLFYHTPSKAELTDIFTLMVESGGSEPGFINGREAQRRAPWFKGVNPCAEILLGNASFCNLTEIDLGKFNGRWDDLCEAARLISRANYRQTCVDLRDGVLQTTWHELNQFLRLCGVGITGFVRWEYQASDYHLKTLRNIIKLAANGMADDLGLPRPKAVTTVKPSGTLGKVMDTTEGGHKPLSRYLINNVKFSIDDPIVEACKKAGYRWFPAPNDPTGVILSFPVAYPEVDFEEVVTPVGTLYVNRDSAVSQLERYKRLVTHYADHNVSITVSYEPSEVPDIVDWLHENWDVYVGVSFLFRADPLKTAEDLGFPYLPQQPVTKEAYEEYSASLLPVVLSGYDEVEHDACSTGACPIK
jgi:ribonucleoside-triphosphate reductase (formate)